jgi:hypothetical protein
MVTAVKNRALLSLWLLVLRMIAERSRTDLQLAARCGGILAGVVPSHLGMSPDLASKTMLQPSDFWVRDRLEVSEALSTLLGGGAPAQASRRGRDLVPESEYATGRALGLMVKTWRESHGLAKAYGVPWAAGRRLTTRRHAASPGRAVSRAAERAWRLSGTLPRLVIGSVQGSS